MISARQLVRRFGDHTAVHELSFEAPRGEVCVLIGPNGAGKSTTVKMLTGLLAPTSGTVIVCGTDVNANPLETKRKIGVLPENLGLFGALTVEEHLALTGSVYGLPRHVARDRSDRLLSLLDLEHGRNTLAENCSHGMRKKASLAMALLPDVQALFLDEPFEAIDPVTSRTIRDLLVSLSAQGVTIFLTSHILSLAEQIATKIMLMREGQVAWAGKPSQLPTSLEDLYLDLVEAPKAETLDWLGSPQS
ncbi:MAG: ABC transporter ATP-binding protein [Acidobacteria bacterium]|nr:ABC transporter ATP-binding protein [Acidobacteriota bacterium]MDA1233418.1 ABC transporter ATP-binding protein [Acidobacteriota bacterium]